MVMVLLGGDIKGKNKLDSNNSTRFFSCVYELKMATWFPGEAEPIVDILLQLERVKDKCFGWELKDGWREAIYLYTSMFSELQIYSSMFLGELLTVTWKIHSI